MKRRIAALILCAVLMAAAACAPAEGAAPDLDLSVMPASIAYAQAVAMLQDPASYVGKTVRVSGIFNYSALRGRGVVIVADRAGCCETSVDFVCADALVWPDDYPALYSRFTLTGVFDACEGEEGVYVLRDAVIEAP